MRLLLLVSLLLLFSSSSPLCQGHNITKILAKHPEFSTFNHYLSVTHLASDINRLLTITVLVVDNAGMSALLSKNLTLYTMRNVLKLHVLDDYFGAKKLHQLTGGKTTSASMYQATGAAPGTTGYVNISDHRAGHVTFAAQDAGDGPRVSFVKSIKEMPYNISVIQVSSIITSPEAEAPTPAPAPVNLTELMSSKGCKLFSDLLIAAGQLKAFQDNVDIGLTLFCPVDAAVKAFMPKYKNLTTAGKKAVLLYHGYPEYYSIQMLKSNNGEVGTLASDGTTKKYSMAVQNHGEVVTLKTRVMIATITSTILDEDPVAVYKVDKVLEPKELFKVTEAPAPAPATKGKKKHFASPPEPEGPDASPAADENATGKSSGQGRWVAVAAAAVVAAVVVAA